jgi:predicted DNA-binding transcriptional regulator AlpA
MSDTDDPTNSPSRIPFKERPTCIVAEACKASGLGRSKLYELMDEGRPHSVKLDKRRLIVVPSLLDLLRG